MGHLPVDCRQCRRQASDIADDRVTAAPEQGRKVRLCRRIDGHAKDRDAEPPRLLDGFAGVLDRKAPLIVIDIVRLAVGENEQKLLALRLARELCRGVAHCCADPRVVARLQRTDAALHEWLGLVAYRVTGQTAELWPRP